MTVNMLYDHRPAYLVVPGTVMWDVFAHVAFTRLRERADAADFTANPTADKRKRLLGQLFPQLEAYEKQKEQRRMKFMEEWADFGPFFIRPPAEASNDGPALPKGRIPSRMR